MKMRSHSDTSSVDGFGRNHQDKGARSAGAKLIKGIQRIWGGPTNQPPPQMSSSTPSSIDGLHAAVQEEPQLDTPLTGARTLEQCLEGQFFHEASQLLIERENRLFGDIMGMEKVESPEEEVAKLSAERAALEKLILQTVKRSLSLNRDLNFRLAPALSSAVRAIQQEEHQDQLWRRKGWTPPDWRPCGWRRLHDARLRELVEERMENPPTPPSEPQAGQSSIKASIHSMGLRMKEDLLLVVEAVRTCYPPEMDICNFYAAQYHRTFSSRVSSLAQFVLDDSDCSFLLRWVNDHYPRILQKLSAEIDSSALGKLLTDDLLEPLEEQYLSKQQTELTTYMDRVLEEARDNFTSGEEPAMEDGCYVSTMAFDIIQFIHGMVTSAEAIVGDLAKAQRITCELKGLMQRFQSFQAAVIKQNRATSRAQVKANLSCIAQFSDVLRKKQLLPADLQENCLSVLSDMKQSAHTYLLTPVHKGLKPHYQKLGTNDWLHNSHFEKLLVAVEKELQELQGSIPSSNQELMGQLHREVTEEYVKRLLRGEVRLKDKEKQLKAYATVKDDADSLHRLFSRMGSQEDWLKEILHKIAEVLRLQDVPALQMQVVLLGSDYPDLSEKHVSALLKLKTNISKVDRRTIKATLVETLDGCRPDVSTQTFFSRVDVR
uniref:Exocyst complex component Sec6 n=2 Tax=Salarias fasciatus TaxID=181472 RepID=A0A672HDJ2_SALFA